MSIILGNFGQKPDQVIATAARLPHEKTDVLCLNVGAGMFAWMPRPGNGWQRYVNLHSTPEPPCAV